MSENIFNDHILSVLNDFPADKYNVLIPVATLQAVSGLQKMTVKKVQLDTKTTKDGKDNESGKDIYKEKNGRYAITKVGAMKLAAAANISIIESKSVMPTVCSKCIEMARATGKAASCGTCPHSGDVKYEVTIRVPEPGGGFRKITESREIDSTIEKIPDAKHKGAMAETKAFMRCIRAALTLASTYTKEELSKPFVIAYLVPNLDAPEIKNIIAESYLKSAGFLYEMPSANEQKALGTSEPVQQDIPALMPPEATEENESQGESIYSLDDDDSNNVQLPWDVPQNGIFCEECGQEIFETTGTNGQTWKPEAIKGFSKKTFGRCLCTICQAKEKKGGLR